MPRELTERILSQLRTPPSHRAAAERELRHLLVTKTGSPAPLLAPGNRVVALVGPTGVGKTTTIAKLATHATIVEGKRVALISLDDHRVGAMAQLRAYAELLGTQLHACTSDQAFARALSAARDADIVFVDTPGIAPADQTGFQRLKERLARAGEHVTVHMCLSAATRQEELDRTVQLYQGLEPSAIIATKLDEAVAIGTIVAARLNLSLPLSYVTTGQQVPEDIEPASPVLLTDALLGAMSQ